MTSTELIESVLLDLGNPDDDTLNAAAPRARVLRNAQRVVDQIWLARAWSFRMATASVTISAATAPAATPPTIIGSGYLPSSFMSFGKIGGLFVSVGISPLEEKPLVEVLQSIQGIASKGTPEMFALGDRTANGQRVYAYPIPSADQTVTAFFDRTPPLLSEDSDDDEIAIIGEPWVELVVYEGTLWRELKAQSSPMATEQFALYQQALQQMIAELRPGKTQPSELIPFTP